MMKLYVESENKLIYEVQYKYQLDSVEFCQMYDLVLVGGYDYINPDTSDLQGYVGADRFIDDVQLESVIVYIDESLKGKLEDEGYWIVKKLPVIHESKERL